MLPRTHMGLALSPPEPFRYPTTVPFPNTRSAAVVTWDYYVNHYGWKKNRNDFCKGRENYLGLPETGSVCLVTIMCLV